MNKIENAPALELDKILYKTEKMLPHVRRERRIVWYKTEKMLTRVRRERRIVWNLFKHLATEGWYPVKLWDGEEYTKTNSAKDAMEGIFNLDDVHVLVQKNGQKPHSIFLVLGNDIDVLSDWTYSETDSDGFNALMDKFDPEMYA